MAHRRMEIATARNTLASAVLAASLVTLAAGGCAGTNQLAPSNPQSPQSSPVSSQRMDKQIYFERLLLCEDAWSQFERECKRDLTVYSGIPHTDFCRAFARKRWPEQVLPACRRSL